MKRVKVMSDEIGMVHVPRGNLQALFDIAVNSMDFGSGFLVDEEVEQLRAVAELLGVDPVKATPYAHLRDYPHAFVEGDGGRCERCNERAEDAGAHPGEPQ